ncbi:hypothetical protein HYH03_015220 [Edaphochlamys debaryana]|uniref:C3H1-type domain-containing protein n=1 Tax=Edaphochlamys debaryana TaxID=47281 RepID=A0A835XPX6_9CHLO|nr:hypothetical protein HYH03_015220 [Edaphochlamys debaryana]|eukprot:KAG2486126.1 hypothetical protein HYH03_015220 [Edaphochlamys debaryana]
MAHCLKHKGNYSDEFWMLSFKVVPCTKTYAHSWSSCPCAHPGETARRRDPTLFNYQPVLCPNVKSKAGCPAGDSCAYAHNVFEQWLHPQRYKALMCTYGSQCTRPSCFFAHSLEELRVPWKPGQSGSAGTAGADAANGAAGGGNSGAGGMQGGGQGLQGQGRGNGPNSNDNAGGGMGLGPSQAGSSSGANAAAGGGGGGSGGAPSGGVGGQRTLMQSMGPSQLQQMQQLQQQHHQHQQQQQQQQQGGWMAGFGGMGGLGGLGSVGAMAGLGGQSVVDVRLVAAGGAQHPHLASDPGIHLLSPNQANALGGGHPPHQAAVAAAAAAARRLHPGGGPLGSFHHHPSSYSAPYDLEIGSGHGAAGGGDGSLGQAGPNSATAGGAAQQNSTPLFRSESGHASLYVGLTEDVPLTGPGGGNNAGDGLEATSSGQMTGLTSLGIYVGGQGAEGGGGGGGGGNPQAGGRVMQLGGAPQLQQHLAHLHQAQMHIQQQQQQQQQQQRNAGGMLSGPGAGPSPGPLGRQMSGPMGLGASVKHVSSVGSGLSGGGGNNSGPHDLLPNGTGGNTATLDLSGTGYSAGAHSSTLALPSTHLLDISEEDVTEQAGPAAGSLGSWVPLQSTASSDSGRGSQSGFSTQKPGQQAQQPGQQPQQQQQQQGYGGAGSIFAMAAAQRPGVGGAGLGRSYLGQGGGDNTAAAAMAEGLRGPMGQLQINGGGGAGGRQTQQMQMFGGPADLQALNFRRQASSPLPSHLIQGAAGPGSGPGPGTAGATAGPDSAGAARIDPEVELLLLSSLQLQLSHAGVASHPAAAAFPAREWLRQALQGRGAAATRTYLMDLLAAYVPPETLTVVRRLLDCLDEATVLLSCFSANGGSGPAGPGQGLGGPGGPAGAPGPGGMGGH